MLRRLLFECLLLGAATLVLPATAPSPDRAEYEIKAAFLFNLAKFVEWPPQRSAAVPLTFGILGKDPFQSLLDGMVQGKHINGRPVTIKRFAKLEEVSECDVLFVSRSEKRRLEEVFSSLQKKPILTVGDTESFAERGGMVGLTLADNKVGVNVNVDSAKRANLKISSRLLQLATIVHGH